ncbi:MAG: Bug family tripartite tricarboxylate transporter substrate binding protein [Candidatus Hydrothermarchaeaceae archaeon]
MNRNSLYPVKLIIGIALLVSASTTAWGEEPYKGKTLRFIVAYSPGGGFDTYTRAIARHISKHIPGHPTTIVQNMTGAGGFIAANYMYNKAKPDGLTIGNFIGGLVQQQILGNKGVKFDGRKFEWIGVPVVDHPVCGLTKVTGIKNIKDWQAAKRPIKVGGIGPGGTVSDVPRVLAAALGLPVKVIDGYRGTAKVRLAAEAGELAGGCWAWQSMKVTWRRMVESGGVRIVLQAMDKKHPELGNVDNAIDFAKTDEARALLKYGIHDTATITRFYSLPPRTPKKIVKLLRKAFMDTMRDPKFLSEAKKSKLEINPVTGERVEKIVQGMFKLDAKMVSRLKEILVPKR